MANGRAARTISWLPTHQFGTGKSLRETGYLATELNRGGGCLKDEGDSSGDEGMDEPDHTSGSASSETRLSVAANFGYSPRV